MSTKTIGILGGMGPEAAADCFAKIIRHTPAARDQDHLHVILENNPAVPDRTNAILKGGESPVPVMAGGCQVLERAGADFIIIVCNTAHYFLDDIQKAVNIPILSILDVVAQGVEQARPKIQKIGLLATWGTIEAGIYQKRLAASGLETLVPDAVHQDKVMAAIRTIKGSPDDAARKKANQDLSAAAASLVAAGAQGVVGGCTEIPLALGQKDMEVPFFDSQLMLAKAAILKAGLTPSL